MNKKYYLLVDAGNSLCKFYLYQSMDNLLVKHFSAEYSQTEAIIKNELQNFNINFVFICSVKHQSQTETLIKYFKLLWQCEVKIFKPGDYQYLPSLYHDFFALGADRWASILALYLQNKKNYCVIDCGTAITVDYVIDEVHIGGLIGPGLHTLSNCLTDNTDRIEFNNKLENFDSICFTSKTTSECILNASKVYFNSFIEAVLIENKTKYGEGFTTYITGGDNISVSKYKNYNVNLSENLVIEGLFQLKNK